ncbi:MAG: cation-translocating P-type ATPase, partial [Deltaproteobacteria bacterium]|nr:cation-translocating P-type ATPase [Deltaproteobacteria bacterium]
MCCHMEADRIRTALAKIPEVVRLEFDMAKRVVVIEHRLASPDPLGEALAACGLAGELLTGVREEVPPEVPAPPWKRLILASGLAMIAEVLHWNGLPFWGVALISAAAFIITGFEVYKEGLVSFRHLRLDMNALMSLAVTGAVVIGEVAEGAMVLALFSLAEALEDRSLSQARAAIAGLLALAPDKATVSKDGQWQQIRAEEVPVGTLIQIRPGEKLPLDGKVVSGFTAINQAPVTGESIPVDKSAGDPVFAGTINGSGSIEYETTALFKDSTLAKVASFVEEAESQKAPVQRLVDRFAAYYTPAVFGLAFLAAVLPPLLTGASWSEWAYKALVMLVISCPCALVISVPVTILCGLAAAAKKGLVIKGGAVLEQGRKIKFVALDKTGTLTTGQPKLSAFVPLNGADPDRVLLLAASLASRSDHPVSRAVFESFEDKKSVLNVQNLMAFPGKGIGGQIEGRDYRLGNVRLLAGEKFADPETEARNQELIDKGQTAVILIEDQTPLALLAVSDSLKEDSIQAVRDMKSLGLVPVM